MSSSAGGGRAHRGDNDGGGGSGVRASSSPPPCCEEVEVGSAAWNRVQQLVEAPELVVTSIHRVHSLASVRQAYIHHRDVTLRRARQIPPSDLEAVNATRAAAGLGPLSPYRDHEAVLFHKPRSKRVLFEKIIKEGRIASSARTSDLLGRGLYFTDSLAECLHHGSAGHYEQTALVCLVTLGDSVSVEQAARSGLEVFVKRPGALETPPKKNMLHRREKHFDFRFDSWFGGTTANEYVVANGRQVLPLYVVSFSNRSASQYLLSRGSTHFKPISPILLPTPEFIVGSLAPSAARVAYSAWNNAAGSHEASELQLLAHPPHTCQGPFCSPDALLAISEDHQEIMMRLWSLYIDHLQPATGPVFSVELATAPDPDSGCCHICFDHFPEGAPVARLPCCHNARFHFSPACFHKLVSQGIAFSGKPTAGLNCPFCRARHGVLRGKCPDGTMCEQTIKDWSAGSLIRISFDFPAGTTPEGLPDISEGLPYPARHQEVYLPDCAESQAVLRNLRVAFELRQCFSLDNAQTTETTIGPPSAVISEGPIPLQTMLEPGPYGFQPDPEYLRRLDDALMHVLGPFYQPRATETSPHRLEDVLCPAMTLSPPASPAATHQDDTPSLPLHESANTVPLSDESTVLAMDIPGPADRPVPGCVRFLQKAAKGVKSNVQDAASCCGGFARDNTFSIWVVVVSGSVIGRWLRRRLVNI